MQRPSCGISQNAILHDEHKRELKLEAHTLLQNIDLLQAGTAPDPVRGTEGLETADRILRERKAVGIVIGSMLDALWSHADERAARMERTRDTDVLVLAGGENLETFEGNIDWWRERGEPVEVTTQHNTRAHNFPAVWWQNGGGVPLHVRVEHDAGRLEKPGLYIPGRRFAIDLRKREGESLYDERVTRDEDLFEELEAMVDERTGFQIPPEIAGRFGGCILDGRYDARWSAPPLRAQAVPRSVYVAINDRLKTTRERIGQTGIRN